MLYFPSSVMTHVAFFFFFPSGVTNLRAAQSIASAGKTIKQKDIKKGKIERLIHGSESL